MEAEDKASVSGAEVMVAAFAFWDWGQVCEGEPTQTILVLGWEEAVFILWALHCLSLRQINPGRRFCVDGETLHSISEV